MGFIAGLFMMGISVLMMKYREYLGNTVGEADWMRKVGGVYYIIIFTAILLFLWGATTMFGLTDTALRILLGPLQKVGF